MTTGQIVILVLLFLLDLARTVYLFKNGNENVNNYFWDFMRIMVVYILFMAVCLENNRLSKKNPCPELVPLENAYQIK